jgi:homocysteine S-methyltransferase
VPGFRARLASGPPLVGDGGMGALLSGSVPKLRCPEEANLRAAETVLSLHLAFIRAGAELIETNTFGANRRKLRSLFLEEELAAVNQAGVKIAREAREVSGRSVFVAGAIGPLADVGDFIEGDLAPDFVEQAALLDARGVDLFALETFFDLEELVTAVEAVRSVSALPIVTTMTFDDDGETFAGVPAEEAARTLAGLDVAAMGANCGTGPQAILAALARMQSDRVPLAVYPNVGPAGRVGGRIVDPQGTPDYFAEFAAHARDLGARLIGGCCGTTVAQIAAIRRALEQDRAASEPIVVVERDFVVAPPPAHERTRLQEAFETQEWVVSVEIDPPAGANPAGMLEFSRRCEDLASVGFVDVNDTTKSRARINSLMASIAIERATGLETIPHITPRDLSVTGIESLLLGAHAEGIRNVLAVTGDPPASAAAPDRAGVYEVDSIGICRIVAQLNQGEDWNGRAIDAPTSFHLGVAVNPTADDIDYELRRFEQKIEAGAQFAMTQALFDLQPLDRFVALLGGQWPIPALLGVWYVTSYRLALHIHNEVPGVVVQDHVQERFRAAGPDAAEVGWALARELMQEARERVAGVYVIPPFKRPEAALELLD